MSSQQDSQIFKIDGMFAQLSPTSCKHWITLSIYDTWQSYGGKGKLTSTPRICNWAISPSRKGMISCETPHNNPLTCRKLPPSLKLLRNQAFSNGRRKEIWHETKTLITQLLMNFGLNYDRRSTAKENIFWTLGKVLTSKRRPAREC